MKNHLEGGLIRSFRKIQGTLYTTHNVTVDHYSYLPVARWTEDPRLKQLLKEGNIAIGAIAAAGHMPESFSDADITNSGYEKRIDIRDNSAIEKLRKARNDRLIEAGKLNPEKNPNGKPLRFVDTPENINLQRVAIKNILEKRFTETSEGNTKKVLFSVCSISAGFDINYIDSVIELMDEKRQANGVSNVLLSLFVPFNMESVMAYSTAGQGLSQGETDGWAARLTKIQSLMQDPRYIDNIFIHEAKRVPYFFGDRLKNKLKILGMQSITHQQMHKRGQRINGDENSVYWDVNEMMVLQALDAVGGDVRKIFGISAEAFQKSNSPLGGWPQVQAELTMRGVIAANITNIEDGLTDVASGEERKIEERRRKSMYEPLIKRNNENRLYQAMWKRRLSA